MKRIILIGICGLALLNILAPIAKPNTFDSPLPTPQPFESPLATLAPSASRRAVATAMPPIRKVPDGPNSISLSAFTASR